VNQEESEQDEVDGTKPYLIYLTLPSKVLHGGEYLVTRLRAEQVQVRTQCATRCNCSYTNLLGVITNRKRAGDRRVGHGLESSMD